MAAELRPSRAVSVLTAAVLVAACSTSSSDEDSSPLQGSRSALQMVVEVELAHDELKEVAAVTTTSPGVFRPGETVEHDIVITVHGGTAVEVNGLLDVDRALGNQLGEGLIRLAGRCAPPPEDVVCPGAIVAVQPGESRAFTVRVMTDDAAEGVYTGAVPLSWSSGGSAEGGPKVPSQPSSALALTYRLESGQG